MSDLLELHNPLLEDSFLLQVLQNEILFLLAFSLIFDWWFNGLETVAYDSFIGHFNLFRSCFNFD